jgi:hypothetical protein
MYVLSRSLSDNPMYMLKNLKYSLTPTRQFFSYIMAKKRIIFNKMMMRFVLYLINMLSWIYFRVPPHWNNSCLTEVYRIIQCICWKISNTQVGKSEIWLVGSESRQCVRVGRHVYLRTAVPLFGRKCHCIIMSEWVSGYCLTPTRQFFSYIMATKKDNFH